MGNAFGMVETSPFLLLAALICLAFALRQHRRGDYTRRRNNLKQAIAIPRSPPGERSEVQLGDGEQWEAFRDEERE